MLCMDLLNENQNNDLYNVYNDVNNAATSAK